MIHYTLLPENEMKSLRREYRSRLFIVFLFFISSSIIIGILILIPSYAASRAQETQALFYAGELQKGREARGIDQIENELNAIQAVINQSKTDQAGIPFSDIIKSILSHRTAQITIASFTMNASDAKPGSPIIVTLDGKALTRDSLIAFKSSLESDKRFSSIDLPISDLAKSKDIGFSLRLLASY